MAQQVSLCVQLVSSQQSSERGQPAQWIVSAWTKGGNVPDATIRLQASPASGTPEFSFGCGSSDSTASCDLGAMDAKSAPRQLQAQVTVPVTASTVNSVSLTVIGSAAHLPKDPEASATVMITTPPTPVQPVSPQPVGSLPGIPSVGNLPGIPSQSPYLSPGGNAAGLFPTIHPPSTSSPPQKKRTVVVANNAAFPGGAPVVGAQLIGLAALALAFVLTVTRLSIRRRPAPDQPTGESPPPGPDATGNGKPEA